VGAMAQKMSLLAQHDYLTDLPNRVLLQDRLSQALATIDRGSRGALLFLDLDFFKQINDSIGHHAGDRVLQEVARRLKENVRADDTVSRQGGDEFVLLLVRLADPRDAARVAEKLIQSIEQPIEFEGQQLRVSASIGIALFPQDARDTQTLMKQADTALYHAKEAGRGRYSYFTGIMSARAEQRMRVEHDLRFALANEDLFLAFQPKVTLPDGRITGMEALVRWRRCDTGEVVPPNEFIPLAEEIGLITAIDEWVMREACRQNRAWQDAGLPAIPVSVNVSLARFDPERLLASVAAVIEQTGIAPHWLEIEFTESQMFGQLERAQALISQLKGLGVQVAIDDFGTGYSGLSYLMRYRFDVLKIDRSFVQGLPDDPRNKAIVQAIVAMARALDYRVVAEGVETSAQADALSAYGCSEMQGFLYGRPLPASEFAGVLRRGSIIAGLDYEAFPRRA
jgi:diguanylate cyclase (GGDEF)-like protein